MLASQLVITQDLTDSQLTVQSVVKTVLVTLGMQLSGGVIAWHAGHQSISLQAAVCVRLYWNSIHQQS